MAKRKEARLLEDRKSCKLSLDERETAIFLDATSSYAEIDTTVPRDYNRLLKKGWRPAVRYLASDGSVVGYTFKIPRDRISFLGEKKPREVTPEMRARQLSAMQKAREAKKDSSV